MFERAEEKAGPMDWDSVEPGPMDWDSVEPGLMRQLLDCRKRAAALRGLIAAEEILAKVNERTVAL